MAEDSRQASVKIEVTPEMEAAGGQILEDQFDASPSLARYIAVNVFEAMMRETHVSAALAERPANSVPRNKP